MRILTSVKLTLKRRATLQKQIEDIDRMLKPFGGIVGNGRPMDGRSKPRKMSAATRRKMAAVAKARWAKAKKAGKTRL